MTAIIAKNIQIIDDWGRFPQLNVPVIDWKTTRSRAEAQSLRTQETQAEQDKIEAKRTIHSHYLADMAGESIVIE